MMTTASAAARRSTVSSTPSNAWPFSVNKGRAGRDTPPRRRGPRAADNVERGTLAHVIDVFLVGDA